MYLPDWFEEDLREQSGGRFRIRWSEKRHLWQVEQKETRAKMQDRPLSPYDDEGIRERDGFSLFCEISPRIEGKCERCKRGMKITQMRMKTTVCPFCKKEHKLFYWHLGEGLLEHMRKVDPDRGGIDRSFQEVDKKTDRREKTQKRDNRNLSESIIKSDWNYLHEIQSVGYTGISTRYRHRDKGLR